MPGGRYSARVLIYSQSYAGTGSGGNQVQPVPTNRRFRNRIGHRRSFVFQRCRFQLAQNSKWTHAERVRGTAVGPTRYFPGRRRPAGNHCREPSAGASVKSDPIQFSGARRRYNYPPYDSLETHRSPKPNPGIVCAKPPLHAPQPADAAWRTPSVSAAIPRPLAEPFAERNPPKVPPTKAFAEVRHSSPIDATALVRAPAIPPD